MQGFFSLGVCVTGGEDAYDAYGQDSADDSQDRSGAHIAGVVHA